MTTGVLGTEYGRCPACGQLKRLNEQGGVWAHNRYRAVRTVVRTERCPGSLASPETVGTTGQDQI